MAQKWLITLGTLLLLLFLCWRIRAPAKRPDKQVAGGPEDDSEGERPLTKTQRKRLGRKAASKAKAEAQVSTTAVRPATQRTNTQASLLGTKSPVQAGDHGKAAALRTKSKVEVLPEDQQMAMAMEQSANDSEWTAVVSTRGKRKSAPEVQVPQDHESIALEEHGCVTADAEGYNCVSSTSTAEGSTGPQAEAVGLEAEADEDVSASYTAPAEEPTGPQTRVPFERSQAPPAQRDTGMKPAETVLRTAAAAQPYIRQGTFRFLDLPRELRDVVYDLTILGKVTDTSRKARKGLAVQMVRRCNDCADHGVYIKVPGRPALTLACRQLSTEFLDTLRRQNTPHHLYLTIDFLHTEKMRSHPAALAEMRNLRPRHLFLSFGLQRNTVQYYDIQDAAQGAIIASAYFKQIIEGIKACTHVTALVIDWASSLHRNRVRCPTSWSPKLIIINELMAAVETLPKLKEYAIMVHQDSVHASRNDGQQWYQGHFKRSNRLDPSQIGDDSAELLRELEVRPENFPGYQDLGVVVSSTTYRAGDMWLPFGSR